MVNETKKTTDKASMPIYKATKQGQIEGAVFQNGVFENAHIGHNFTRKETPTVWEKQTMSLSKKQLENLVKVAQELIAHMK